ncbi:hypothetical protein KFK09_021943 [Dendrobium nobile]|uniref:DUF4283 domain-containing protein n=1 Tax=Dendrobium nobile TaxID=94219 RepID=A0A8T3AHN5_DENNO|nr:hypothetical protein KFK09_021943 [Dendrobium nobile]
MAVNDVIGPGFLNENSSSGSFLEVLSGASPSAEFPDLRLTTHRGLPSLWISEEEVLALVKPFEFSLIGFFPARRPSLDAIRHFFFNLKLIGTFSVTLLNARHVLIKLSKDLDYSDVFSHRSYFVNNCFMKLSKWSPFLDVNVESPIIPIWISFPNLRPHFFSPHILHGLRSLFGKPFKTDNAIVVGSRPSVASVLVELDITKRYPDRIWLGPDNFGYVQSVEMEDFPSLCGHCKSIGQSNLECAVLHPNHIANSEKATNVMHDTLTRPLSVASPTDNLDVIIEDGVDPILSSSPSPVLNDGVADDANMGMQELGEGFLVSGMVALSLDRLEGLNNGFCDGNTVVLNDSNNGLVVASEEPSLASSEHVLSPRKMLFLWMFRLLLFLMRS